MFRVITASFGTTREQEVVLQTDMCAGAATNQDTLSRIAQQSAECPRDISARSVINLATLSETVPWSRKSRNHARPEVLPRAMFVTSASSQDISSKIAP